MSGEIEIEDELEIEIEIEPNIKYHENFNSKP